MPKRTWPQIRAGLIALAIFFGLVDGCPLPPPGIETSWSALQPLVDPTRRVQRVVEWPVAWLRGALQISQRWALYQAPGKQTYRMWIEGLAPDGAWRILFRSGDPEHTEDVDLLEEGRVWGVWDAGVLAPRQYASFAQWIANRQLARHAELAAVRVRMERIELVRGGFLSSGEFIFARVFNRSTR